MPEYLSPGVYVEETSFRSKSIEGVSTSTAGFVGPTRWGPVSGQPELLTSLADFELYYGGPDDLVFDGVATTNYLWHGVRAFFEEGGQRLYVSRIFNFGIEAIEKYYASYTTNNGSVPVTLQARFPGAAGSMRIFFTLRVGPNILSFSKNTPTLTRLQEYTLLYIRRKVSIAPDVARAAKLSSTRYTTSPAQDAAKVVIDAIESEAKKPESTVDTVRKKAGDTANGVKKVAEDIMKTVNDAASPTPSTVAQAARTEADKHSTDQAKDITGKIAYLAEYSAKLYKDKDKTHNLINELKGVVDGVSSAVEAAGHEAGPSKDSLVQAASNKANSYTGDDKAVADLVVQAVKSGADVPDILNAITAIKNIVDSLATAVDNTANPTPDLVAKAAEDKASSYTGDDKVVADLIARAARDSVPTADTDVTKIRADAQTAANDIEAVADAVSNAAGQTWQAFEFGNKTDGLFIAHSAPDGTWMLNDKRLDDPMLKLGNDPNAVEIRPITVLVEISRPIRNAQGQISYSSTPETLGEYNVHPLSPTGLTRTFTPKPTTRLEDLTTLFAIRTDSLSDPKNDQNVLQFAQKLLITTFDGLNANRFVTDALRVTYTLASEKKDDGAEPNLTAYEGNPDFQDLTGDSLQMPQNGFLAFEAIEDISIVAAPGYSAVSNSDERFAIERAVINHCEKMRYRVAVLDTPKDQLVSGALDFRNLTSSKYAALYYPWITILDPVTNQRLNQPPSGFVAGIYARNDTEHGVFKAPANEVVRLAIDFEQRLNKAQQDVLNPEGVNCFRFFPGRGFLLWGARTISDDPEWKYISVRRYFAYLEHSIDRGTQWVVFENNNKQLWDNVRRTVEDFLLNEWKMGALMGDKPEQAYFVRCDLSTMTQNDLDNGRLVCLIGVAVVKPAEFVIFRIGQKTATVN